MKNYTYTVTIKPGKYQHEYDVVLFEHLLFHIFKFAFNFKLHITTRRTDYFTSKLIAKRWARIYNCEVTDKTKQDEN